MNEFLAMEEIKNSLFDALSDMSFSEFSEECCNDLLDALRGVKWDYDWEYGATKIVIMPKNMDFVVKIPFLGHVIEEEPDVDCSECPYRDENGCDSCCYDSEWVFREFCLAGDIFDEWDYCKAEKDRYNHAKEFGLEKALAETQLWFVVNNYPIYIQPKCSIFSQGGRSKTDLTEITDEKRKTIRSKCDEQDVHCFNVTWLCDLLEYFGDVYFEQFLSFLKENNYNRDLHSSNIGYLNGKPVLVDYSGFYD